MEATKTVAEALEKPFGTAFADNIAVTHFRNGRWQPFQIEALKPMSMHPATHVLHYASTCFEGLKAHRWDDGSIHVFRLDRHMARLEQSAYHLCLPVPPAGMTSDMILSLIGKCAHWAPEFPGALYIRPTLLGTDISIGAAAGPSHEATLYILLSPVGAYFKGGFRPLRILIDDQHQRTCLETGMVKTGGNYAAALRRILDAREKYKADQVLFAPNGDVQETGAANFMLINDREIVTKPLDPTFLHGITRDAILTIGRELGYTVSERNFSPEEVLQWCETGEAALTGTAAVISGVGTFIYHGKETTAGDGTYGPNTMRIRNALIDLQRGKTPDHHQWLTKVQ